MKYLWCLYRCLTDVELKNGRSDSAKPNSSIHASYAPTVQPTARAPARLLPTVLFQSHTFQSLFFHELFFQENARIKLWTEVTSCGRPGRCPNRTAIQNTHTHTRTTYGARTKSRVIHLPLSKYKWEFVFFESTNGSLCFGPASFATRFNVVVGVVVPLQ